MVKMEYCELGKTGLRVSRICLGTWEFTADWGEVDVEACRSVVRKALDVGINFIDTAQAYGFGEAERILGEALAPDLKGHRDEIFIATKGGMRIDDGRLVRDSTPEHLRAGLEDSLRLLGTEYVDIYQLHWPDLTIAFEETATLLERFVAEGKARHIGVSNFDAAQMTEFEGGGRLETLQPPYSLFRRDIEREVLPYCRTQAIGVLPYGVLAHGLLTGKYTVDWRFPANDWRSTSSIFGGDACRRNLEIVRHLKGFAEQRDCSVSQLAVAWVLANPAVHSAIVGARSPRQLEETAESAGIELTQEELEAIDGLWSGAEPIGPPGEVPGVRSA